MSSKWSEVKCNYRDEEEGCICIDAWKTNNHDEEGGVVAKVYKDRVEYIASEEEKDDKVAECVRYAKGVLRESAL